MLLPLHHNFKWSGKKFLCKWAKINNSFNWISIILIACFFSGYTYSKPTQDVWLSSTHRLWIVTEMRRHSPCFSQAFLFFICVGDMSEEQQYSSSEQACEGAVWRQSNSALLDKTRRGGEGDSMPSSFLHYTCFH